MVDIAPPLRRAARADAPVLAELVNYAGEDLPLYLWQKLAAPGESAWEVGRKRAERDSGSFSYRNAVVVEHAGRCVGCPIGYEIPDAPVEITADMPAMFVPLQELENLAPSTWYVNVLAVVPELRNKGFGGLLLQHADAMGRALAKRGMSVIVAPAYSRAFITHVCPNEWNNGSTARPTSSELVCRIFSAPI